MAISEKGKFPVGDPIITPGVQAFVTERVGEFNSVRRVSGGLVHHVYNVLSKENSYYLKIRGSSFSALPHLTADPAEIVHEANALEIYSAAVPDVFPHVIGFDKTQSAILMTDVNPSGKTLVNAFDSDSATPQLIAEVGKTLGQVHGQLANISSPIREDGDQEQYETNLKYRMLRFNDPVLNEAVEELKSAPRQLIVGDISPKNVGINDNGITLFDLESAHMGNAVFETGYALGHIILHTFHKPGASLEGAQAFLRGYKSEQPTFDTEGSLLRKITAATILYRLKNEVIPYKTVLSDHQKDALIKTAFNMINFTNESNGSKIPTYDQGGRIHPTS